MTSLILSIISRLKVRSSLPLNQSKVYKYLPGDDEFDISKAKVGRAMKERMGLAKNPLDGALSRTSKSQYMFQYFLKVVSTRFRTLDGLVVSIGRNIHSNR